MDHLTQVARFPFSLAYLASYASLWLANSEVGIFPHLAMLLATPAYLTTGTVRVMLGAELMWAAPGLMLAATLLTDVVLFRLVFRAGESRGVWR